MACIVVAGAIGSGKSTVAALLAEERGARVIRVREALRVVLGLPADADRRMLQEEGVRLDRRTRGSWLAEYLLERAETAEVVVDSARTERQTLPILERVPDAVLVYLEASAPTRERRFAEAAKTDPVKRSMSFPAAMNHPTEREVRILRGLAHVIVETDDMTARDVVDEVQSAVARLF